MNKFGIVPQMGVMALAGAGNSAIGQGEAPDGSWDWAAPLTGIGGLAAGAGLGYLGANSLVNRASLRQGKMTASQLAKFKKLAEKEGMGPISAAKKMGIKAPVTGAKSSIKGLSGMSNKSRGTLMNLIAENPNMTKFAGAGLGGLVGASMLAKAVSEPRNQLMTQHQQVYAQQDAQNQMRDMQLAYGGGSRGNW